MKFDAKYPEHRSAQKLYPNRLMGPHDPVELTPEISQSWRVYPCLVCGVGTGWRFSPVGADYPGAPACSEECVETMKQDRDTPSEVPTTDVP